MKLSILSFAFYLTLTRMGRARPTSHDITMQPSNNDGFDSSEVALQSDNLYGWRGCSVADRSKILEAIHDSRDIRSTRTAYDFADWRQTPEAVQLFGQVVAYGYHGWSSIMQQNFMNTYSFVVGSSGENIEVFRHDQSIYGPLKDECSSIRQPDAIVVARNYLGRGGPALMFGDSWFRMQSWTIVKDFSSSDLDSTEDQARAMITALMLVPSTAPWPRDHYGASMTYRKQRLPGDNSQRYVTSAAVCEQLMASQDANFRRAVSNADTYTWYAASAGLRDSNQRRYYGHAGRYSNHRVH